MSESQDWRLQGQDYLREQPLVYVRYEPPRAGCEHDHCEFCWQRFSTKNHPELLQEGYVTTERHWICEPCYEDFKGIFEWRLAC